MEANTPKSNGNDDNPGLLNLDGKFISALLVMHSSISEVAGAKVENGTKLQMTVKNPQGKHLLQGNASLSKSLLDGASHSFAKNFQFIDSMQAHLSFSLLRATVFHSLAIFQYAIGIFDVTLLRFRESIKTEIRDFFPVIVLRCLDGSDFTQKSGVLRLIGSKHDAPAIFSWHEVWCSYSCSSSWCYSIWFIFDSDYLVSLADVEL